jgi:hypothetical protein
MTTTSNQLPNTTKDVTSGTCLFEQVANSRRANTNKELHKLRRSAREKGRASLASHSLGEQRLACMPTQHNRDSTDA